MAPYQQLATQPEPETAFQGEEINLHSTSHTDSFNNASPSFQSNTTEEHDHLIDAFDGPSDSEDDQEQDWDDDRQIEGSQQPSPPRTGIFGSNHDQYQPIQGHSSSTASLASSGAPLDSISSIPPTSFGSPSSVEVVRPIRPIPPQRGLLSMLPWRARRATGPSLNTANQNDGVFANLSAKPETDKPSEDVPPTYEEAALDQTPPYWETTIMAPGFGDEVFIEGLPVGSPINFVWNMMVSSAFQFVGFLLTYLLHTSHAAKQGSRAGLGFTLFQYGFYLQPDAAGDATTPSQEFEPSQPNNYEVDTSSSDVKGSFRQGALEDASSALSSSDASSWISIVLMVLGGIMIMKAISDYLRARKMEAVIQGPMTASTASTMDSEDSQAMV